MRNDDGLASVLKLVMPAACCGAILGKGGKTVKQFVEESGASISVLPQVQSLPLFLFLISSTELRFVRYRKSYHCDFGRTRTDSTCRSTRSDQGCKRPTLYQQRVTLRELHETSSSSPRQENDKTTFFTGVTGMYPMHGETGVPYVPCNGLAMPGAPMMYSPPVYPSEPIGAPFSDPSHMVGSPSRYVETEGPGSPASHMAPMGMSMPMPMQFPVDSRGPRVEMSISVPDDRIGAIIGKGGDIITQLQTLVGVKIIISSRHEFEPGTRNRRVTIIGPPEAVQIAHMLISMKERSLFLAPSPGMYPPGPYLWTQPPTPWVSSSMAPPIPETNGYSN